MRNTKAPNAKPPSTKESVGPNLKTATAAEPWEHRPQACRVSTLSNASNQCAILRCVLKTLAQQTCKSVVWLISDYCASVVLLIFPKTKTMCSEGLLCNLWSIE